MANKTFKLHQVVINTTTIKGIMDSNIINSLSKYSLQGGGSLDPFNIASLKSDQGVDFITNDLKTFLDLVGISGYTVSGSTLAKFYFRQLADGGVFVGSTNDIYALISKGLLHFRNISCQQFGVAQLGAVCIPTYNGTDLPVKTDIAAAAPTLSRDNSCYTLGGLKVNGTFIPIQSFEFDLGLRVETLGGSELGGSIYNTEVFITARNPEMRFNVTDASVINSIAPMAGKAVGGDVIVFLRKYTMGGGLVANATEEHIKFTMKDGMISSDGVKGNSGVLAGTQISITPAYNATDAIIAISTASAIS